MIEHIRETLSVAIPISIDVRQSEVARAALDVGINNINDVAEGRDER